MLAVRQIHQVKGPLRSTGVRVAIGKRATRDHVIRIDTLLGRYEELNSPVYARTECEVQRALLPRQPSIRPVACAYAPNRSRSTNPLTRALRWLLNR